MEPPSHSPIKVTSTQYPLQGEPGPVRLQPTLPTTPNLSGSPDGKKIAFASDRMGSMDIFGGKTRKGVSPKELTTHSGNETPDA